MDAELDPDDADDVFDLVIVGSGGGALCAALAARALGKSVVVLEKNARAGGSTGYSGGVLWVPNNPVMARENVADSEARSRTYFDAVVTYRGPATSRARRTAFLRTGPEMISFLEKCGIKFRRPEGWSDYYDDRPGGEPRSRSLMVEIFDRRALGDWADRLSIYPPFEKLPLFADEAPALLLMRRGWAGKRMAARLAGRMLMQKLTGRRYAVNGGALQGRMLKASLGAGVPIRTGAPVSGLMVENGAVVGVSVEHGGRAVRIRAREGVLVNTGGFSRNAAMRAEFGPALSTDAMTSANPGDTGEAMQSMMALGAATDCMDEAWWLLTSRNLDGSWPEGAVATDGSVFPFLHHLDLSLPNLILVDQSGARFADESGSYMEIGRAMHARQRATGRAIPAWVIMDSVNRKYYPWGSAAPGTTPKSWLDSGYMKRADTIEALAALCGIDAAGLAATVSAFNGYCATGIDADFNRGGRAFDRAHGDPSVKPNPNLGPVSTGPFYAVAMYPGDVGTAGGVVTDEHARVLRKDGSAIQGLYATGNCTASVMGRSYPGAGASISASFVFGYIAAHHAAGKTALLPFDVSGETETAASMLREVPMP